MHSQPFHSGGGRQVPFDLAKWNRRRRRKLAKDSGAFKRHIRPREIASAKVKR